MTLPRGTYPLLRHVWRARLDCQWDNCRAAIYLDQGSTSPLALDGRDECGGLSTRAAAVRWLERVRNLCRYCHRPRTLETAKIECLPT